MVKEQARFFLQDSCLMQWIKIDCAHLQAVIQHFVFPLLFSAYSVPYLLHTIQSYFQDRFTRVLTAFLWL